ncbi:MAG: TetR/AcrR family transcriptional regulator [Polyangiaceae bacterium]
MNDRVDKAQRRKVLLDAARDVFADKGYHDAKVEDIAERANVAKGTFYLYFKDKRAVLEELVDGLFMRITMAIVRVDVGEEVTSQLVHNIRAIVAVFLKDLALTRVLLSYAAGTDPAFVEKVSAFYDGARTMLRTALEEGQDLGIVAKGNADVYATFTLGALKETLLQQATSKSPRPREEIVAELFRFLEGGYLRTPREVVPLGAAHRPLGSAPERPTTDATPEAPRPAKRRARGKGSASPT